MLFVATPLYWLSQLCESVARLADVRREQRRHEQAAPEDDELMSEGDPHMEETAARRQP